MTADWHDAHLIEATTKNGRRVAVSKSWSRFNQWREVVNTRQLHLGEDLSDVRVIVDRDGRVVPPQITDEMVERAAGGGQQ